MFLPLLTKYQLLHIYCRTTVIQKWLCNVSSDSNVYYIHVYLMVSVYTRKSLDN
jgi:hypothetical protein